jgi:hypothetical protein
VRGAGTDDALIGTQGGWLDGLEYEPKVERADACAVCHLPIDRTLAAYGDAGIAWNVLLSTRGSFRMYGSDPDLLGWIDGVVEPAPTGSSKLCLGCHDGISATNETGAAPVIGGTSAALTNNHPISVSYAWGQDSRLRDPASSYLPDGRLVAVALEQNRVECATCHIVHGVGDAFADVVASGPHGSTTRDGARGSDLCLACHDQ